MNDDDANGDTTGASGQSDGQAAARGATERGEHDPWLREALRHAPDAALAAPAALREAILAEARSAIRPRSSRRTALPDRAIAFWDWLARPAVAAGFASVMAATIVGLMWWDRPMDETMPPPERAEPLTAASPGPQLAAPVAIAAKTAMPPEPTPPGAMQNKADDESPRQAHRDAANEARAVPEAKGAPTGPTATSADAQSMPAGQAPAPFPASRAAAESARGSIRDRATSTLAKKQPGAPIAMPPRQDALDADRPAESARTERTTPHPSDRTAAASVEAGAAGRVAQDALDGRSAGATSTPPPPAASPAPTVESARDNVAPPAFAAAPVPAAAPTLRRERAAGSGAAGPVETESSTRPSDTPNRPVAALLEAIDRAPQRWRRADSRAAATGLDAATREWLRSVETAAAGRWQEARSDEPQTGSAAGVASLLLERDGQATASLRVEADGVRLVMPSGTRFAPLPVDALARLRETLPPPR